MKQQKHTSLIVSPDSKIAKLAYCLFRNLLGVRSKVYPEFVTSHLLLGWPRRMTFCKLNLFSLTRSIKVLSC